MYNLFLKDFYLVRKHLWYAIFYGFMMFFMFSAQGPQIQSMVYALGTTLIAYTMLMYTTAYDDKNNSEALLNSLPISRIKIVLARYLSIVPFALLGLISMVLAGFIVESINLFEVSRTFVLEDFIGALVGLCLIAFMYLPAYFKFGYVKAKMFNLILFVIAFAGPIAIATLIKGTEKPVSLNEVTNYLSTQSDLMIALLIMLVTVLLGFVSFGFSVYIYQKREF